ncbi:CAMK family protein kinase [Tritrichomonas foetus]|uniref:CAMK family protein kinase n=1 Tax=Tritrichomonas foetus TaxID=1144522 RepID=A0A1J4K9D1_9EUKA|nr:CAMK family protein kinase [Tritrichomonas foetus]|eukprot:OHT07512.1 CAMK family protein kinase [Tritrichomonas foetus]
MEEIPGYKLFYLLGEGATSQVFSGIHQKFEIPCAIKLIKKSNSNVDLSSIKKEVDFLKNLSHPYISSFFDFFETDNYYVIVEELAGNGSLRNYIKSDIGMRIDSLKRYFFQICQAIQYLHNEKHLVHRDLKPDNILIDDNHNVKLIDFGFCHVKSDDLQMMTQVGSINYMPPEIVQNRPYDYKCDIWSLGVLLYAMAFGVLPFYDPNIHTLMKRIVTEEITFPWQSSDLNDLISLMLNKVAVERPTINEVLQHKFFRGVTSTNLNFDSCEDNLKLEIKILDCFFQIGVVEDEVPKYRNTPVYRMVKSQALQSLYRTELIKTKKEIHPTLSLTNIEGKRTHLKPNSNPTFRQKARLIKPYGSNMMLPRTYLNVLAWKKK